MRSRAAVAALGAAAAVAAASVVTAPPAAAAGGYTITVNVAPLDPHVGDTLTVSGKVTPTDSTSGLPVSGQTLQIKRTDRNGTSSFVATTSMDGSYSQADPVRAVRGTVSYTVSAVDGSTGHRSVLVHRLPTSLKVTASRTMVRSGHDVRITVHLGATDTNRTVAIYAKPYHLSRRLVVKHSVDASGDLSATPTLHRRTRFIAHFGGDDKYAPASARVLVMARAVVTEHLHGGYATVNGIRLYHVSGVPVLAAHLHPELGDRCLWFKAQRRANGAWHTVAVKCFRTDSFGHAEARFTGDHSIGTPYRVRARWRGGTPAAADAGPWLRIEFR